MTPEQYKAAIKKLGLSQERAGKYFGFSPRVGQSWALGESPVPEAVVIAMTLMLKDGLMPEDVVKLRNKRWGKTESAE
ncbi:hypothetical protein ABIF78_007692 [Bradyrhizobium japonicum]